jgi:hypothetical protein
LAGYPAEIWPLSDRYPAIIRPISGYFQYPAFGHIPDMKKASRISDAFLKFTVQGDVTRTDYIECVYLVIKDSSWETLIWSGLASSRSFDRCHLGKGGDNYNMIPVPYKVDQQNDET